MTSLQQRQETHLLSTYDSGTLWEKTWKQFNQNTQLYINKKKSAKFPFLQKISLVSQINGIAGCS